MWVYVNGEFTKEEQARISVFDHGFLYGDGAYETCRAYEGRILLWERHFARLCRSCDWLGLQVPFSGEEWETIFGELLAKNQLRNAGLRLTISRGEGPLGIDPGGCLQPTIVVMVKPLIPYILEARERGLTLHVASVRRNPPLAQNPQIKSLSFLNNILAKQEATASGADDALMLNMDEMVTECTTSNIFFVSEGHLCTPSVGCGLLEGITREIVMELAKAMNLLVEEGQYSLSRVQQSEECFMTNTGLEIMPVIRIGDQPIGSGVRGPLTSDLQKAFQEKLPDYLGPCIFPLS